MDIVLDFFRERFWLSFSICLILSPFAILLLRKLSHFLKLAGFYPRARPRPPWARSDMKPDEISAFFRQNAAAQEICKHRHNKSIDHLHWQIYRGLQTLRRRLSRAPAGIIGLVPASQWLFDNYNLFYKELMKLQALGNLRKFHSMPTLSAAGENGYPRVYRLARDIVSCCNYHLSDQAILDMLAAYQDIRPILARELWTLPEMLVLCLLEKVVDESRGILEIIKTKHLADHAADRMAPRIGAPDADFSSWLRRDFGKNLNDDVFVSHLYYRLKALSVSETDLISWLTSARGTGVAKYEREVADLIETEAEYEADTEAIIRSLVISLKVIADVNWDDILQKASLLDRQLAEDPAGIYRLTDAQTRSRYRRSVEKLAQRFNLSENEVAGQVLAWANTSPAGIDLSMPSHIGSFLVGRGLEWSTARFAEIAGHHWLNLHCGRQCQTVMFGIAAAILTLGFATAGLIAAIALPDAAIKPGPGLVIVLAAILLIIGISMSIRMLQDITSHLVRPQPPLALDFQDGIPDNYRTFVVMPVILSSVGQAREYINRLEKHYLANRQENLCFALLADLNDAPAEIMPSDAKIIESASQAVHWLNTRYPCVYTRFFMLHRMRQWNPSENCWMGWERKRGKLEELNALLSGAQDTSYVVTVGDQVLFRSFKYVITLDADTELIRESAATLVGIMAHPLNQPQIDERSMRIIDGYAIVQPEIRNRIPDPGASLFARFFAGQTGFDPYATVVSDVYQDIFDEGTFVGKGIYDVEAMHRLLRGNIPENSVLSHDLLEGSLSRCAFASSVKLMDTQPTSIISYIRREHRWIRGDWQLLPWLRRQSAISWLARWKMIDNLRRSLVQPAALILILICALGLPGTPWLWLPFICFDTLYSVAAMIVRIIIQKNRNPSMRLAFVALSNHIASRVLQLLLEFMLIPSRGLLAVDAIARTLYRLLFSHRNLLEWQTAEAVDRNVLKTLRFHLKTLWPAILPAIPLFIGANIQPLKSWMLALYTLSALWLLSPLISWLASRKLRPFPPGRKRREQVKRLRLMARRTWNYFEDFSRAEHHWLCPDNYQKYPGPKISDKTSPTNIGLQLLSILSAHDLGFISLQELVDQCERVMDTIKKLPKWHGHLFNWYQVNSLHVLDPQYISTVDSGNFVAHLIALKQGLAALPGQPVMTESSISGMNDTLGAAGLPDLLPEDRMPEITEWTAALQGLSDRLDSLPTDDLWKKRIGHLCRGLLDDQFLQSGETSTARLKSLYQLRDEGHERAGSLLARISELIKSIDLLVIETDFRVLYDRKHMLFRIGYNISSQTPDTGHYDLMASEARLSSFLAVAKGDVPQKHWFALGRPFTLIRGTPALLSWSGSMFEYLMPNLVMKTPPGSIFSQSSQAAVTRQIIHGRRLKMPWGISESQFYAFDVNSNYQYSAFGVMRLRLQSTLRPAMVVAPYATMLALMVKPHRALVNIDRLYKLGANGEYGFFEALDFNRPDSANLRDFSLVQSVMAHHLGMSLTAIDNYLNHNIMQNRFHQEPMIQAAEVLLDETVAVGLISVSRRWYTISVNTAPDDEEPAEGRYIMSPGLQEPVAHVLANRQYMVMLTSDGEGFSVCENASINRWRADPLNSGYGSFIYIRNLKTEDIWSSAYLPTRREPDSYQVVFSPDKAEFNRRDGHISTRTEVTLMPMDNLELRKVTLTNNGDKAVNIELTSYLEVVADDPRAESSHPAFSKLFIETEYDEGRQMLIARRRTRSAGERQHYVMHRVVGESPLRGGVQFEIDRRLFIGRNGNLAQPQVLFTRLPLSGHSGFSTDPILSLRAAVAIPAGHSATVVFLTGYAQSREEIINLSTNYDNLNDSDEVFKKSLTSSILKMKYLSVKPSQLNAIQGLVSAIYYPSPGCRGPAESIERNQRGQSGLWRFGISGDNPIMMLRVNNLKSAPLINEVLLAFEVLIIHHVKVDLVILNDEASGYTMELNQLIHGLTSRLRIFSGDLASAGIFIINRFHINAEEDDLLTSVARLVITQETGIYYRGRRATGIRTPVNTAGPEQHDVIRLAASREASKTPVIEAFPAHELPLEFFNGLGGFAQDGREYVIRIRNAMKPPSPWINVIANEKFGFIISETGAGYTWAGNSRENKLTSWSNDPVLDPVSEAVFIRDETSGAVTSPCMLGGGFGGHYQVRHGFGYSIFEHDEISLRQQLAVFSAARDPVKLWLLTITNNEQTARNLTAAFYVEWLLGVQRDQSAPFVVTDFDRINDCLTARNTYSDLYREHRAFIFSSEKIASFTGSRREFLGTTGFSRYPQGLSSTIFSGSVGAGLDPCGVLQVSITLEPGESRSFVFGLGQAESENQVADLVQRFRGSQSAAAELETVRDFWEHKLGSVLIRTPDRALDILMNGWLRYQVLSCRIQARAAFYQCGGAIGFRDQLQDVMAFLDGDSDMVRRQILLCCSRQFLEGDVQHWWHPPTGIGVRTKISDDLLWLPFVTAEYIRQTGDAGILSEKAPWLSGEPLQAHQSEIMFTPQLSITEDTVYRHCMKAIERAARFGDNGLPLMGGGDWNDGMNLVGIEGRGESVWLGWFLYTVLHRFIHICKLCDDLSGSRHMASLAANLKGNLESSAWDGQWYLRAFFDNGNPMGSHKNQECQIDSISQSWAVISGAADPHRAARAIESARQHLVKDEYRAVLLLTPPFDKSADDPGYIRGYFPGIRENGGQYTHSAVWLAIASARLKHVNEAWRILGLLNPIGSTADLPAVYRYEKEPYVLAGDISMADPIQGRAGWSWYTGSAGWLYQAILHSFLGVNRHGGQMEIDPCIPAGWRTCQVDYRYGKSTYQMTFLNKTGHGIHVQSINVDGQVIKGSHFPLFDDGRIHPVIIQLTDKQQ